MTIKKKENIKGGNNMDKKNIVRTDILCPDCFNGKLIENEVKDLQCERCGMEFVYAREGSKAIRYKEEGM